MRMVWLIFGFTALILAIIGIILPLLPTVPFLLLAAFCFARSSEKIHKWLLNHPKYGPPIHNWQNSGSISIKSKQLATVCMLIALIIPIYLGLSWLIVSTQIFGSDILYAIPTGAYALIMYITGFVFVYLLKNKV